MVRDNVVGIRLTDLEVEKLDQIAKEEGRSRANLMQFIISNWLDERSKVDEEKSN